MTEQKHTPGPWVVFNDTARFPGIEASSLEFSIVVFGGPDEKDEAGVQGRTKSEALANARLIAAAPDLLEVARKFRSAMSAAFNAGTEEREGGSANRQAMYQAQCEKVLAECRAAIAKAEGKE